MNCIEQRLQDVEPLLATEGGLRSDILDAMRNIDRAEFVPDAQRTHADQDRPLPIGHGQTVSQPTLVAIMTHLLVLRYRDKVLEIGTGCGYQTAILAALVHKLYTIELTPELAHDARSRLLRMGLDNIRFRIGDGHRGWPEAAPFDKIIVTAAAERTPRALLDQLADGGRLLIPLGRHGDLQKLTIVDKSGAGATSVRAVLDVRFVPLRRSDASRPAVSAASPDTRHRPGR